MESKEPTTYYPSSAPSEKVTVVRARHPFEGRSLNVFGAMHRKGQVLLVLILPDGSKSLIPADWTDLASPMQSIATPIATTLGSLENLLHARALVDALLGRLAPITSEDGSSATTKESACARKKPKPLRSSPRRNLPVGSPQRGTQNLAIQIVARLIVQAARASEEKGNSYE